MTTRIHTSLSPEEWLLVSALRKVPEGRLRERLGVVLDDPLLSACETRCAEAQADGLPCHDVHADCEQCQRAHALLEDLRGRLP